MAGVLARARASREPRRRRWLLVNADRLIAWQLNWRGENFYSGGEIHHPRFEDARTVYIDTDSRRFLDYLNAPARKGKGRTFWIITEKQRFDGLKTLLPGPTARATVRAQDDSCNKFALGSFTLD